MYDVIFFIWVECWIGWLLIESDVVRWRFQQQDRLRVQNRTDRRFCRRKIPASCPILEERVQFGLQGHHWCRISDQNAHHRSQDYQGTDLGHCWPGKVRLSAFFDASLHSHTSPGTVRVEKRRQVEIRYPCVLCLLFMVRLLLLLSFDQFTLVVDVKPLGERLPQKGRGRLIQSHDKKKLTLVVSFATLSDPGLFLVRWIDHWWFMNTNFLYY